MTGPGRDDPLTLLDWKRRVFDLYHEVRIASTPEAGWQRWRQLFRVHPQSLPSDTRVGFGGLDYFPYDSALRVAAEVVTMAFETISIGASAGKTIAFERFGRAVFALMGETRALDLYWLEAYGGGLFLPFADTTNGSETYPAGRYLLDTVKGADLGGAASGLVLDFNFAYNPSCAYDPCWVCPLVPHSNRLTIPIRAGERTPAAGTAVMHRTASSA